MAKRRSESSLVKAGAAIYAGAAAIGAIEAALPSGASFSVAPAVAAAVVALLIWVGGTRVHRNVLFAIGPLGAALIAVAVGTTHGPSDAAILYAWPVLWVGCFYGP